MGSLSLGAVMVQAHEMRQLGAYTLAVGFRAEPAFEDVVNAIDIFINRTSDNKAISVRGGDIVDLQVKAQFLEAEDSDADILAVVGCVDETGPGFCGE